MSSLENTRKNMTGVQLCNFYKLYLLIGMSLGKLSSVFTAKFSHDFSSYCSCGRYMQLLDLCASRRSVQLVSAPSQWSSRPEIMDRLSNLTPALWYTGHIWYSHERVSWKIWPCCQVQPRPLHQNLLTCTNSSIQDPIRMRSHLLLRKRGRIFTVMGTNSFLKCRWKNWPAHRRLPSRTTQTTLATASPYPMDFLKSPCDRRNIWWSSISICLCRNSRW